MRRQALVIGLGQFGMSLARSLVNKGFEVLTVDINDERLAHAHAFAETLQFDATDIDALARVAPERRDVCICAIGDEDREASIICTALLRQLNARRIVARASDDVHARILQLVGATEVVNPERDFGERYAMRLLSDQVIGELHLGSGLVLAEIEVPEIFASKTLKELKLPNRFSVTVVATKLRTEMSVRPPGPETVLSRGDIMLVVGTRDDVTKLLRVI